MAHELEDDLKQLFHELNSNMGMLTINLDLAARRIEKDSLSARYIQKMEEALEKATHTLKKINRLVKGEQTLGSLAKIGYILIVDDEPYLRTAIADSLEILGYKSLEVGEAGGCLKVYQDGADEISLVLLDVRLPSMDGVELYHKIQNIKKVPVIFMSGFGDGSDTAAKLGHPINFLSKPFSIESLESKVRQVLDR